MKTTPFQYGTDAKRLKVHNVFRYPAKFHPPVAAKLVEKFSSPGDRVLDPFCGSGTLLIEAIRSGRDAFGGDVDPLAVFISTAKTSRYDVDRLEGSVERVLDAGREWERSETELKLLMFEDLTESQYEDQLGDLWVPAIPNLSHWFRRYVTVDLARLLTVIEGVSEGKEDVDTFLRLAFAAIIRNASNADPVPVSGLEVTSHMRRRDAEGRPIDVWSLFRAKVRRVLNAVKELESELSSGSAEAAILLHDARLPHDVSPVQAVITSPPYQSAVDYYRRHQLEMFWLRMTETQSERLALLPRYVGRANTPQSHADVLADWTPSGLAAQWLDEAGEVSANRARDFRAYFSAMTQAFASMAEVLEADGRAVIVVGRSQWGGVPIPTEALFKELAPSSLELVEHLTYPITNRTMSYTRHNGADINEEHILVLAKQAT